MRFSNTNVLFSGRKLIIATKHKKERVISPIFTEALAVICFTDDRLDTDELGTFTGEIERLDNVLGTARKKCMMAMELSGCDMAVASEGSFSPHPTLGFIHADDELLLFVDQKHHLEIAVRELSTNTNFNGEKIDSEKDLLSFAKRTKFPGHGLIVRRAPENNTDMVKGITDYATLKNVFYSLISKYGSAYVETDMRAMFNPTRMDVIQLTAQKLTDKINSSCPMCSTPGFGAVSAKPGLPCCNCGFPTKSTLLHAYQCVKCNYNENRFYPNGKRTEEPTFCDNCNP